MPRFVEGSSFPCGRSTNGEVILNRRNFLTSATAVAAGFPVVSELQTVSAQITEGLKITSMETETLRMPPGKAFMDAIHRFGGENGGVVLRLKTNSNIVGWGYISFGAELGGPRVVEDILQGMLKPVLIGQDPTLSKKLRRDMWKATEYSGTQGLVTCAMAAVDMALWDIVGKAAKMPVYRLLGGFRTSLPTYDMCGWYYDNDEDLSTFTKQIADALEEGFRAVKIKVGRYGLDDDIKRIKAAQDLLGKDRRLMVDANQVFNFTDALARGRVYQELGCFWYEEPMMPHEKKEFGRLAEELDIRIATGENLYGKYEFLELLRAGGADVVQPDNRRAGGVSEWMEIGAIADAFNVELASHGGGPTNMHMLLAMPNAIYMESGSLKSDTSHVETLKLVKGEIPAPEDPGMGNELRREWIDKYKFRS
jgi:L-alanine-DL-glutamate epimerase-like enolase superfamily enzyme